MGTTSNYTWPYPESTGLVKDGWEDIKDLATAADTSLKTVSDAQGLVHIKTVSDSGVSSLSIGSDADPLFTSDFQNYLILYKADQTTLSSFRLRANTTDASGSNYDVQFTGSVTTTVSAYPSTNQTSAIHVGNFSGASVAYSRILLMNPQLAEPTAFLIDSWHFNPLQQLWRVGRHTLSTAYNGITFISGSGNFTTIQIQVFGYKD